jgi:hypothetical protein
LQGYEGIKVTPDVFNICLGAGDNFNLRVLLPEKFINLIV